MIAVTTLCLGAPLGATPPTFASDFYVGRQDAVAINQGGYYVNNGMCCSMSHSAGCKIQGINMGADTYEQGSQERTRSDSAQGAVVNWYGKIKKKMAIVPGAAVNSSHAWACVQYCPIEDGEFVPSLRIGDGTKGPLDTPKDMGPATITQPASIGNTTKVCEQWKWTETLLKVVPMQVTEFFVDMGVKPPAPFFEYSVLKPFNKPFGQENSSFIGYKAMDVSKYFDIDPDSVTTCPMSTKCNPPPPPPSAYAEFDENMVLAALSPHAADAKALLPPKRTIYDEAKAMASTTSAPPPNGPLPPQPNVSFVGDFSAHENVLSLIAQGATHVNGDPCCMATSPAPQCQVQLQHKQGMRYLDVTNQRTRFEDAVGMQTIVDDYNVKKEMLINVTNGVETCQEYCPIDPSDSLHPIDPFDPFDATKDLGKTTFEGKPVEHYQWKDVILKVIVMSTTDFYADTTNPKAAIPVASFQQLTPFGQKPPIGTTNQTWSAFKPGTPPAAKFHIAGVDTCPMSSQCQQQSLQHHRLALRQFHTAAQYLEL